MYRDIAKMDTATVGTGTITLGSVVAGFLSFDDAGYLNSERVTYIIEDGSNREVGRGIYTTSGTTLTRDEVLSSTNAGAKISLSGSATVFVGLSAQDVVLGDPLGRNIIKDEFVGGSTTTINIGELGWQFTNGSMTQIAGADGHPGIYNHSYNSTTPLTGVFLGSVAQPRFVAGSIDEAIFVIKVVPVVNFDNTCNFRFGLADTYSGAAIFDGVAIERLAADTSWYGVTWNNGSFSRSSALVSDANMTNIWHQFRIKRYSSTDWGFKMDNDTELHITSGNLPADTDIFIPFFNHYNSSGALSHSYQIDYFHLKFLPQARF